MDAETMKKAVGKAGCGWMKTLALVLILYYLAMGFITYLVMAYDKRKSKKSRSGKGRIPERRLFWLAFLGGAGGGWLAMHRLRHKTNHKSFQTAFPLLTMIHLLLVFYLFGQN